MNQPVHQGGWRRYAARAFRRRSFLWKFALGTLLIGGGAGYGISKVQPSGPDKLGERVLALSGASLQKEDPDHPIEGNETQDISPAFAAEIRPADIDFSDVLHALPTLAPHATPAAREAMRASLRERFSPEEADLAFDYLAAWVNFGGGEQERLEARADRPDAPRFANYVTGRIELRRKNYQRAYERFHQEGERESAGESRYMAVHALLEAKDFIALARLTANPRYGRYVSPYVRLQIAIGRQDWRGILDGVPRAQIASYEANLVIVTAIVGLAWTFFLGHLGELPGVFSKASLLCLCAIGLGALSTVPTVYLVIWEEDIHHFVAGADPAHIFAYNIGGVAAREELCKLLFFLPLLPFLIRRANELEVLIVASFVGLGFAIEENCSYFMMSEATSAPGRFLTANFFHIALTGMNGLALSRVFTRGAAGLNEFLFILPVSILAHGSYDALLDLPGFEWGGYAATAVYAGFAMFYFKQVHPLRGNVRMTIGLTGAFIVCSSLMAATVIGFVMIDLGPAAGLAAILPELLGNAVLLFLFFREFDEKLEH